MDNRPADRCELMEQRRSLLMGGTVSRSVSRSRSRDHSWSPVMGIGAVEGRVPKLPLAMDSDTARSMLLISFWLMAVYCGWKKRQSFLKALRRPILFCPVLPCPVLPSPALPCVVQILGKMRASLRSRWGVNTYMYHGTSTGLGPELTKCTDGKQRYSPVPGRGPGR